MQMNNAVNDIFELCATYLVRRVANMVGRSDFFIARADNKDTHSDLRPNRRSEIFIYGTDITVRLQVFFNKENFRGAINHLYIGGANDQKVDDFFNELGNMVCGRVKHIMVLQGVNAAVSLPIAVRIGDRPMQLRSEVLTHVSEHVINKGQDVAFAARVSLAIHKPDKFIKFDPKVDEASEQNTEAEFF